MDYTVLSPWAKVDVSAAKPLSPRVKTLAGKTIGFLAHFKEHSPYMLREVEAQLKKRLPDTKFSHYQYKKDTREVKNDPENLPEFTAWVNSVDVIVAAYGDAGSCAMFLAYNAAYAEALGKPVTMLVKSDLRSAAQRGASARLVPHMRFVECEMQDLSFAPAMDEACIAHDIRPFVEPVIDELIASLTTPLTNEEMSVPAYTDLHSIKLTGTREELSLRFYKYGWSVGAPIELPTEEAVSEMLAGTDLPRDYVVGVIPPMNGIATVEKLAVNAVMAGCLPTYFPVVIAMVRGMLDPRIHLEGWTCSVSSWFPLITLSGKITQQLGMNKKGAFLSQYFKASSALGKAYTYIMMNIGGVRPTLEDMSELGHESRTGVVLGENDIDNPWEPLHVQYGIDEADSAVTMFWPQTRLGLRGGNAGSIMQSICSLDIDGWDSGLALVFSPKFAKKLAEAGMSRKDVAAYIVEYSRRPSENVPLRWITGNNHEPEYVPLPMSGGLSARRFWNDDHIFIVVGGSNYSGSGVAYGGGGDHGGPSCTKIELPKNWDELVKKYADYTPEYIDY